MKPQVRLLGILFLLSATGNSLVSGDSMSPATDEESDDTVLAEKLENPVAALVSVPFQSNIDLGQGINHNGLRYTLKAQPVTPITINSDWNVISRTILPFIEQNDVVPGHRAQFGLGDTKQSFFFSPNRPGPLGIFWGARPAFMLPTATDTDFGNQQFGAGPTLGLARPLGSWNFTLLTDEIWSFAGNSEVPWGNNTLIQPAISYTLPSAYTLSLNMEASRNWTARQWTIPVNLQISHVFNVAGQKMSVGLGGRYFAVGSSTGPDWGARLTVTFLFPKEHFP